MFGGITVDHTVTYSYKYPFLLFKIIWDHLDFTGSDDSLVHTYVKNGKFQHCRKTVMVEEYDEKKMK